MNTADRQIFAVDSFDRGQVQDLDAMAPAQAIAAVAENIRIRDQLKMLGNHEALNDAKYAVLQALTKAQENSNDHEAKAQALQAFAKLGALSDQLVSLAGLPPVQNALDDLPQTDKQAVLHLTRKGATAREMHDLSLVHFGEDFAALSALMFWLSGPIEEPIYGIRVALLAQLLPDQPTVKATFRQAAHESSSHEQDVVRPADVIELAALGGTPEELAALLQACDEPQLANVILTTGILDRMDRFDRAEWLASMLPQQPGEELTLGR